VSRRRRQTLLLKGPEIARGRAGRPLDLIFAEISLDAQLLGEEPALLIAFGPIDRRFDVLGSTANFSRLPEVRGKLPGDSGISQREL
jgi:hypothetical protein